MRKKVINFNKFMAGSFRDEPSKAQRIIVHIKKNKKVYIRIGLMTASICFTIIHPAFAAGGIPTPMDVTDTIASTNGSDINREGWEIYSQLLSIGKWVIVVKGGFEIIKATLSSDYEKAKKGFISYLLAYVFLLILPTAMDRVDGIISHLNHRS